MAHRLDPLLCPASIAVVGATQRKEVVGNMVIENLLAGNYEGKLYAINPRYDEVEGVPCFASLSDLPGKVEHVIFAVSDERIEDALKDAIAHGIKAATIYSTLILENDSTPSLQERIRRLAEDAGLLLCGGNGMGFYHFNKGVLACGFDTRRHAALGNVSLISQSGSGMSAIVDVDPRIDFNIAVSTGQELTVGLEDYLDFALEQEETRVVGLFMETSRQPDKLVAAFEKAVRKKIPILVIKVGKTEFSSRLAESHSGALAGVDAVYDALFDRYGVQRVEDLDVLSTSLIMFAQPHDIADGGLVTIHDSGGERQLLVDQAEDYDVALTKLMPATSDELESLLDPGLLPVNPLDAWSVGGPDYHVVMQKCFASLLRDPGAALGAVVHARAPEGRIYNEYIGYLRHGHETSGKPVFLVAARQGIGEDELVLETTREGYPVLDGVAPFLQGARCMMNYRDFLQRPAIKHSPLAETVVKKWQQVFQQKTAINEFEAVSFLAECGIPMAQVRQAENAKELFSAAAQLGYPLVLKTAMPGINHKSDQGGVILGIQDEQQLLSHYDELSCRLGPKVLLASMHEEEGIEMILGIVNDAQFGPVVLMGMGGIHAEVIKDSVALMPPFDAAFAMRALDKLKMRKVLDGTRGRTAVNIQACCEAAALLSSIAVAFSEEIGELDINPLMVGESGCTGLDAMLVLKTASENEAGFEEQACA